LGISQWVNLLKNRKGLNEQGHFFAAARVIIPRRDVSTGPRWNTLSLRDAGDCVGVGRHGGVYVEDNQVTEMEGGVV